MHRLSTSMPFLSIDWDAYGLGCCFHHFFRSRTLSLEGLMHLFSLGIQVNLKLRMPYRMRISESCNRSVLHMNSSWYCPVDSQMLILEFSVWAGFWSQAPWNYIFIWLSLMAHQSLQGTSSNLSDLAPSIK